MKCESTVSEFEMKEENSENELKGNTESAKSELLIEVKVNSKSMIECEFEVKTESVGAENKAEIKIETAVSEFDLNMKTENFDSINDSAGTEKELEIKSVNPGTNRDFGKKSESKRSRYSLNMVSETGYTRRRRKRKYEIPSKSYWCDLCFYQPKNRQHYSRSLFQHYLLLHYTLAAEDKLICETVMTL